MLTYETLSNFKAIKDITADDDDEDDVLVTYLKRATDLIDQTTHRRFFPYYDIKRYPVPSLFADLSNRALLSGDLDLGEDLLEPVRVQTGSYTTFIDTMEEVESGGITARTTTLNVTDVDGIDASGETRFEAGYLLRIDNETLLVTTVDTSANTVTVKRGMFDTRAAAHDAATTIYRQSLTALSDGVEYYPLSYNLYPRWGLRIVWPRTWAGNYGATNAGISYPAIYVTGMWGYHANYPSAWVDTTDELTSAVTVTDTTFYIQTGSGFDRGFSSGFEYTIGTDAIGETRFEIGNMLRVEDELVAVTAVDATNRKLTVLRGQNGSIPLAHAAATPVERFNVHHEIRGACFSIAKIIRESDVAKGGRLGVNESSPSFEVGIPKDTAAILKRLTRGVI